jgi:dTDP-4-dehydrorhamnose reductase
VKALVTGADGQLGKSLLALRRPGLEFVGLRRCDLDVTDEKAVLATCIKHNPDWIFNAAAYTAVDNAETDAANAQALNSFGPKYLAKAATITESQLVHFSTDFVFDGKQSKPYATDAEPHPINVYGKTKREGEEQVISTHSDALVIRTSWVYSEFGKNFVLTMLKLMTAKEEIRVVSDQIGSPTFATNLADAAISLLDHEASGIYHYCDSGVASWYEFANAIQENALDLGILVKKIPILPIPTSQFRTAAQRPSFSVLDTTKTTKLIGHSQHWRAALCTMLKKYKESSNV